MNVLHRLFACAALCGSVACSESGIDSSEPVPAGQQFRTVVIGCGGIDINTRTEIEETPDFLDGKAYLGVRWASGDCIRLWARKSANEGEAFFLENIPFEFDYYSPRWSRAAFTGHAVDMSGFLDDGKVSQSKYDYFAVSPAPASVEGTSAIFDIPAVQSGEFNSGLDIMTAQLTEAPALEKGDTNWANGFCLPFTHHVHVFKITITDNLLQSPKSDKEAGISAIELTFPVPVTGRLTVDATGKTGPVLASAEENKVLKLNFATPKKKGDVVYAFIAPQESISGDIHIKATGASEGGKTCSSVDRTFTKPEGKFACGAVTPLNYNIPERYRCTKIIFSLAEKEGGEEHAIEAGKGYGWGTLGEEIESFRIVDKASGEALPDCSFACNHLTNKYEISCTDEGTGKHEDFLEKYAGKECIAKLTSKSAEVEYAFTFPALDKLEAEVENPVPAFKVPYLFEENFDGLSENFEQETTNKKLDDVGLPGWIAGHRSKGYKGVCVDVRHYSWAISYNSRITSCLLDNIKQDKSVNVKIVFNADWKKNTATAMELKVGSTTGDSVGDSMQGVSITMTDNQSASEHNIPTLHTVYVPDFTGNQRIAWETDGKAKGMFSYENLFIDNIKVSIAHPTENKQQ